ncbi:MAG: signal peptidase [Solirubrobacterales bacterium]|nr:signal peptidase [Solirubrobacterales bacterium]
MRLALPRRRAKRDAPPKSTAEQFIELLVIVAVAVGLAFLIQAFVVKPYRIPSPSMEPTLKVGQRVLVSRIGTHFGNPGIGDIVVFHPPQGADPQQPVCGNLTEGTIGGAPCGISTPQRSSQTFIKRVVAGPGDTVRIIDGHAIVNGKRQKDNYIAPCQSAGSCTFPKTITIPSGEYFMMGDNRGRSDDSRFWGPVPKRWIIGGAFFTYWPPDRIGFL